MHIVFQEEDISTLSESFELDEAMRGTIISIKDDFSVGPVQNIFLPEGIEERKVWWQNISEGNANDLTKNNESDDSETVKKARKELANNEKEQLLIWVAPNPRAVCGYYWLMSQMTDLGGRIFIIFLNNLPFISEKGAIFYPKNLFEIPAREFLKAKKLAKPITPSEFEIDAEEWLRHCKENKMVRVLDGAKKLSGHDEDYYDKFLLQFVTPEWQRANKVISHFFHKSPEATGDAYSLFRLKQMIKSGAIEAQGERKSAKDFEIKKPKEIIL